MKITRRQLRQIIKETTGDYFQEDLSHTGDEMSEYIQSLDLVQKWKDQVFARASKDCQRGEGFSKLCVLKHAYQVGQEMGFETVGILQEEADRIFTLLNKG